MAQTKTSWWYSAKKAALLAAVVVSFLLSGCVILRTDVTFLQGDRWKVSVRMTIPAELLGIYGGDAGIDSLLQQQAGEDWQQLQKMMKKERGRDGSVTYIFTTEGTGLDDLNEKAFQGQATITRSVDGKISFSYSPGLGAQMYGLSITGGQIISSNADEVKGNTAIWHDLMRSGGAQVVLTEASGLGVRFGLLAGGVVLIAVVVAIALWLRSRSHYPDTAQSAGSLPTVYCIRCGAQVVPDAEFCPSCGAKVAPKS